MSMKPVEVHEFLSSSVIGQEETLRYVSVAIFKHLQGEKYGNLLLIGNSGTGKTTIMRAIEELYNARDEFREHRAVLILNANTLATEEGAVDTSRLFTRLEEKARLVLAMLVWQRRMRSAGSICAGARVQARHAGYLWRKR